MFSFCSCSCRGTEKAKVRHAGKIELSTWENVWENKTTSIKEKTFLHNSVAPEQMPVLRRSETQFKEEVVVSLGRATALGPTLGRLWKASPAAPLGTWRGIATVQCRECTQTPHVHRGAAPPATQTAPVVLPFSETSELRFCTTPALPLPPNSDGCLASGAP